MEIIVCSFIYLTAVTSAIKADVLLTGGETREEEYLDELQLYDRETKQSHLLPFHLRQARSDHISAVLPNGEILVAGGENKAHYLKTTEIINLKTKSVRPGPDMDVHRWDAAAATLNGEIWVCGGKTKRSSMGEASCVVFTSGYWTQGRPMEQERLDYALVGVSDRNEIYALGGYYYASVLNSVERYSAKSDKWEFVAEMKRERNAFAAAAVNGFIFACGGLDDDMIRLNTCEQYIIEENRWVEAVDMIEQKCSLRMVGFQDGLYVFGGDYLDVVDRYDFEKKKWSRDGKMNYAAVGFTAVSV